MNSRSKRVMVMVLAVVVMASIAIPAGAFGAGAPTGTVTVQTAVFAPDAYEDDDTFETAYEFDPAADGNTFYSVRTFDGKTSETANDTVDYIAVSVDETGTPIWVETMFLDGRWDSYVYIYAEDATGPDDYLASYDDNDYWYSTYSEGAYFIAPAPGTYYVGVENRDYAAKYELYITVGDARRVSGANRFATAAAVSRLQWDNTTSPYYGTGYGPEYIVVANGLDPADALAGGALATQLGGVMLLTNPSSLPGDTYNEIMRVAESRFWYDDDVNVIVLGGPGAVSDAVYKQLQGIRFVTSVERVAGADRYATAAKIASATVDYGSVQTKAYIVNGTSWADALAVAPVAGYDYAPVLMTTKDDVPEVTMTWLADHGVSDVVVVGGEGVISQAAYDELDALYVVERVSGDNRYETAKEIALYGVNNVGMQDSLATLVSGEGFADALAAAPISWWTGAPVLLTTRSSLHPAVVEYFDESGEIGVSAVDDGTGCYVVGGTAAVSAATYAEFRDLWMDYIGSIPVAR
ncbi:MAG: cell wall-binding repeat-containing protein [Coriobacteriales bacterium]|nr:cell wall-binding repeat-containing protein [Actinomycetes bacterium]